jgi:hypothetical protein
MAMTHGLLTNINIIIFILLVNQSLNIYMLLTAKITMKIRIPDTIFHGKQNGGAATYSGA